MFLCTEAEGTSQSTSNWNYINLCVSSSGIGADVMLLSFLVHLETSATALISSPSCSQLLWLAVTLQSACLLVLEVCSALLRALHSPCPHWAPTWSFVVVSDFPLLRVWQSSGSPVLAHRCTNTVLCRGTGIFCIFPVFLNVWFCLTAM